MDSTLSHSRQLRQKIDLVSPSMHRAAHAFWTHPRIREILPDYLFTNYCLGRATVPLLEAADAATRERWSSEPVAEGLIAYFQRHIPEELHHDDTVLEDMLSLGVSREAVQGRIPSPTVASLVGAQFYWISQVHPIALLGFLEVLEGEPPEAEFLEEVIARTGLPRQALRSFFQHAEFDKKHRDDIRNTLDGLPLSAEHSALLGVSAFHTVAMVRAVFEELVAAYPGETARAASRR